MSIIKGFTQVFPNKLTNEEIRRQFPELVATAEERALAKLWAKQPLQTNSTREEKIFDECMKPHLSDPFRSSKNRFVLPKNEDLRTLQSLAVRRLLHGLKMNPSDVDLVFTNEMKPDLTGYGNGIYLSKNFGFECPVLALESTCNGTLQGLIMADSLIKSGNYKNIIIVSATNNSKQLDPRDTLSWFVGDGVCAFMVSEGEDLLCHATLNTVDTFEMFKMSPVNSEVYGPTLMTCSHPQAAKIARSTVGPALLKLTEQIIHKHPNNTSSELNELVDFCVFHTPTASYPQICAKILGVDESKIISKYSDYANCGAVNVAYNLYHALKEGKISKGSRVLLHAVGSSATTSMILYKMNTIPFSEEILLTI